MSAAEFSLKLGLTKKEASVLGRLKTPHKIQDYLDSMKVNAEKHGDTCLSVRGVLRENHSHCIEAALFAACALWVHGERPILMDLRAYGDYDHVVTLFQHKGYWGAISKSNHTALRWRDPIYKSLREMAMSYFHEYAWNERKTLRSYSRPLDLRSYDPALWVTNEDNCWDVALALDGIRHYPLVTRTQVRQLRPRDKFEIKTAMIREHRIPQLTGVSY